MNSATMIGTVSNDPEIKIRPNGRAYMLLTIAVHHGTPRIEKLGHKNEREWHANRAQQPLNVRIRTFGKLASKYITARKGDVFMVEGPVCLHSWTGKKGASGKYLEIIPKTLILLLPSRGSGICEEAHDR